MRKKILIVEDSYVVSYLVQNLIESNFNAEGFWINDTNEITKTVLNRTSLVVLDHMLYDQNNHKFNNGIILAEKIKKYDNEIPIILFSGCSPDNFSEIYWEKVVDYFVSKNDPNYLQKLIYRIEKYVA